jgi:hypothetical protein
MALRLSEVGYMLFDGFMLNTHEGLQELQYSNILVCDAI